MIQDFLVGSIVISALYVGVGWMMHRLVWHRKKANWTPLAEALTGELSLAELQRSAELAQLAYRDGLAGEKVVFCDGRPTEDAQAYVWKENGVTWVAFRGTQSAEDLWADLDVRTVRLEEIDWDRVRVHAGFYRQFRSIKEKVWKELEGAREVVFCGHSLAGALATIAALVWSWETGGAVRCRTVGSPRVGNGAFKRLFEEKVPNTLRVFNENDVVAMLPMSFRFVHVGRSLALQDDGCAFLVKEDEPWWLRPLVSLEEIEFSGVLCDHDCQLYIERLRKLGMGNFF